MRDSRLLTVFIVATLTLAAGCTGAATPAPSGTASATSAAASPTAQPAIKIKAAYLPSSFFAPLFVGVKQGIFLKHGLDVETVAAPSGGTAGTVAAMTSGSIQFSTGDVGQLMRSTAQNLPIILVAPAYMSAEGTQGILVKADSPLRGPKDLTGKTICTNSPGGSTELQMRAYVDDNGGDNTKLSFISVPYAQIPASVAAGRCDAGGTIEPFYSQGLKSGLRTIGADFLGNGPWGTVLAGWFTTSTYASQNPEVLEKFVKGITEAQAFSNANFDAVRAVLPAMLQITPEQAQTTVLTPWPTKFNLARMQHWAQLLQKYGQASAIVDPKKVLWSGAPLE